MLFIRISRFIKREESTFEWSLKKIKSGVKKEFLLLARDKPAALSAIFMPIILLVLFIFASSFFINIPVAVVDEDASTQSAALVKAFEDSQTLNILARDKLTADRKFKESIVFATVTIPKGFGASVVQRGTGRIDILMDNTQNAVVTTITALELRKAIFSFYAGVAKEKELGEIADSPALTNILRGVVGPLLVEKTSPELIFQTISEVLEIEEKPAYEIKGVRYGLLPEYLPVILAIIMLFFSFVIAPFSIINEKRSGVFERLFSLPVKSYEIIIPKVAVLLSIIAIQSLILVSILQYGYGFEMHNIWAAALVLTLFGFANIALAIFFATISRTALQAFEAVALIIALQMFSLGLASQAAGITAILPLVPINNALGALHQVILKQALPIAGSMLFFLIFGTLFTALAVIFFRMPKPRS